MIYQHPLAYLLGLEGIALLRAFAGEHDQAFTLSRIREIRAVLEAADELGDGVEETPMSMQEGYAQWAPWYDEPGNQLLEIEEPLVHEILASLPLGVALDAACGTGRHAAHLASLGHDVIGVDATPEMLDVARAKVPSATFLEGDLHELPVADDSVGLVVCAIALSHVPDLQPVFAEFARVLRPGGQLVLSDSRGLIGDIGLPLARTRPDGTFGYIPVWSRLASDYLAAALPLGFEVRRCEELRRTTPLVDEEGRDLADPVTPEHRPGTPPLVWALHRFAPEATNAAHLGRPQVIVWQLQLAAAHASPTATPSAPTDASQPSASSRE
ncbi:MAG: class I SAM-dependent methyltransferase [Gaiellaceae bacterium]